MAGAYGSAEYRDLAVLNKLSARVLESLELQDYSASSDYMLCARREAMADFAYAIVCKLGLTDVGAVRELASRDGRDWLWEGPADVELHRRAALAAVRALLEEVDDYEVKDKKTMRMRNKFTKLSELQYDRLCATL